MEVIFNILVLFVCVAMTVALIAFSGWCVLAVYEKWLDMLSEKKETEYFNYRNRCNELILEVEKLKQEKDYINSIIKRDTQ